MQLPPPPKGSCFVAANDEEGRPQLAWQPPAWPGRWLSAFALVFFSFFWTSSEIEALWAFASGLRNGFQGGPGPLEQGLWLLGWTVVGPMGIACLFAAVRDPGREQLTFGTFFLVYEGSLFWTSRRRKTEAFTTGEEVLSPGPFQEFSRDEMDGIRLDRVGVRQRLILVYDRKRFEIGRSLREPEREWLAGVLRAWLEPLGEKGRPEGSPERVLLTGGGDTLLDTLLRGRDPLSRLLLAPVLNTWVVVEHEGADELRLHWLPFPKWKLNLKRLGTLTLAPLWIAVWALVTALFGGLSLLLAFNLFLGCGVFGFQVVAMGGPAPVTEVFGLVLVTVIFVVFLFCGRVLFKDLAALLRRCRPESLTLTPSRLTYDPGNFFQGSCVLGQAREIPREELGGIHVERVNGRQRLTLDDGVRRFEVGACLREPEREWLAAVLRAWAGRPGEA